MTELEKCELAISKGFSYCPFSGNIRGVRGGLISSVNYDGYIRFSLSGYDKKYYLFGHRFAWYIYHGKLPIETIDHKDGIRSNNKISNLRDVTQHHNTWNNTKAKGFFWCKEKNKYVAQIQLNGKKIYLGAFENETQARNAYLSAKEKYHFIPSS
jgi:hypothetical protein